MCGGACKLISWCAFLTATLQRLEVTSQEMEGNVALTRDQEQAYVTTLRCILSDPRVIPSSGFQPNHYALFISTFLARRR